MSLRHLFSRFDHRLLGPPTATPEMPPVCGGIADELASPSSPADQGWADQRAHWRAWCLEGASDAGLPVFQPCGRRRPAKPWALAAGPVELMPDLCRLALDLDGSRLLQACRGAADRFGLRARVKWRDACWWRARRIDDIWDAGWLIDGDDLAQRARQFQPRRATLILALDIEPAQLHGAINELVARSGGFDYAVRLIRLDGADDVAMVGPSGSRLSSRNAPNSHERMPISKV